MAKQAEKGKLPALWKLMLQKGSQVCILCIQLSHGHEADANLYQQCTPASPAVTVVPLPQPDRKVFSMEESELEELFMLFSVITVLLLHF